MADEKTYCPVHLEVQGKIAEIQRVQKERPCQENTEKLRNLEKMDTRLEKDSDAQWVDINKLKRMVYMGAGATAVLAFLGSIIGGLLKSGVKP